MQMIKLSILLMRVIAILVLVLWPLLAMVVVMLSGGPHVPEWKAELLQYAFNVLLFIPVTVIAAFILDRKNGRASRSLIYRFSVWLGVNSLILVALGILIYATVLKKGP